MTQRNAGISSSSKPWQLALGVVLLAATIAAIHGPSLSLGLFMDDHAHYRQLRDCDWSLAGLTSACRLELVGDTVELWWLPDVTLRFFRPVAFGLMKLSYSLFDWQPWPMHGFSLGWHLLVCTLLMVLLRKLGAGFWLALAVAALFSMHTGHVATVQWIACQTELMVTTFLLAATLCFARFRGWPGFGPSTQPTSTRPRITWAIAAWLLFVLALGCRENAVMFPFVVLALEPLAGRTGRRAAWWLFGAFALTLVGYLILRQTLLGGTALPPRPYVMPLTDPDFPRYVFDKAWYYLLSQFLLIPCVPLAGLPYFQTHAWLFYGMAILVAALLVFIWWSYRRLPAASLGVAWLLLFMAPLLPVFAAPHHLYLPGVGWAVVIMLLFQRIGAMRRTDLSGWHLWLRRGVAWAGVVFIAAVFVRGATWLGMTLQTAHRVEECVMVEMANARTGLSAGDTLYVANLPLIGHYARLGVERRTDLKNLKVVPLTWSPRLLGMVTPAELVWIDPQTVEVRVRSDRYFAGPLGHLVEEATGQPIPDDVDFTAEGGVRVKVLARDEVGISALRFEFTRPLTDRDLHLFWGSRARWAYEVTPPVSPDQVRGTP